MRKYWKFTTIIMVIVLSIGSFYVTSAMSAEQNPEFVIQTQSGNAEEIKPLVLEGSYLNTSTMNSTSNSLKITANGTTYDRRSFLDEIIGQQPPEIKRLQETYHSFMRGKNPWVNSFFENNQFVAYADVSYKMGALRSSDFKFTVSVLNKEDDTINSFKVAVPDSGELQHVIVEDVQMVKDELKIITQNMVRNTHSYDDIQVYTINLANQTVQSHDAIIQVPAGENNTHINVQLIETSPTTANDHLIFLKTEEKVMEDTESTRVVDSKQEVISYNLATKESEKITIPDVDLKENQLRFFDGSAIYFTKIAGQELVVTPYRLADHQVGKVISIPLSNEKDNMQVPIITVKDGKLYAASPHMSEHVNADVVVADVKTGETLFKGELALENPPKEKRPFEFNLNRIVVK